MKTIKYLSLILLAIFFAVSCSEEKKENEENKVSVKTAKISGPLSPYFEVVPKDYKIMSKKYSNEVNFEIKRIAEGLPEPWSAELANSGMYDIESDISVEFLDADGNVLNKKNTSVDTDELFALGVGESTSFTCYVDDVSTVASARFGSSFKMDAQAMDTIDNADADLDEVKDGIDKGLEVIDASTEVLKTVSEIVSK